MSARKPPTITRHYQATPAACERALLALLNRPTSDEGSRPLATLKDTRGEDKSDSRTDSRIP